MVKGVRNMYTGTGVKNMVIGVSKTGVKSMVTVIRNMVIHRSKEHGKRIQEHGNRNQGQGNRSHGQGNRSQE